MKKTVNDLMKDIKQKNRSNFSGWLFVLSGILKSILYICLILIFICIVYLGISWLFMSAWNLVMPHLFKFQEINIWMALAILFIINLISIPFKKK